MLDKSNQLVLAVVEENLITTLSNGQPIKPVSVIPGVAVFAVVLPTNIAS